MSKYLMRHGLTCVVALSVALIAAGLQAQSKSESESDQPQAAKDRAEALQDELAAKNRQLDELRESMRKLQAELQPMRDKKQYQEDLAQLDQQSGFISRELGPAEARIHAELDKPTVLEFISTPLEDVALYLKDYHKVEILLDRHALEQAGIGTDTPVTLNLRGVSLRSALALLLRGLGLTFIVDDEVVQITTRQEALRRLDTRTYDVSPLLGESGQVRDLTEVVEALLPAADDDEEDDDDDSRQLGHVVTGYRNLLIVRSNREGHADIEKLLRDIARGLKTEQRSKSQSGGVTD
jgi:hypothetical protein